ncbi:hypothetical protein OUZ56_027382 [Daphnia magna]|uniref:Uncharacterized protein n=1 Tax=Daphnia magna TaxID=35525 RepID=A0ABQ9ZPL4_9CRUS|nr:hypothetical protein OUZ56_027382 [Daphnia magna]
MNFDHFVQMFFGIMQTKTDSSVITVVLREQVQARKSWQQISIYFEDYIDTYFLHAFNVHDEKCESNLQF